MHLRLFELARDYLKRMKMNVVGGIMSPCNSAYNKNGLVSGHHRVAMCRKAVESSNWIKVDEYEAIDANKFVPTLSVLDKLKEKYKQCNLLLLCGGDLFEKMCQQDMWDSDDVCHIVIDYGLIVVPRVGVDMSLFHKKYPYINSVIEKVIFVDNPIENIISSSLVRNSIKNGFSVKYLIDDNVIDYIKKHRLYE